jgi:hypothetical protein
MRDQLELLCPEMSTMLAQIAERNLPLGNEVQVLNRLRERYGAEPFCRAVKEALDRQAPSAASVGHILEQWARKSRTPPAIEMVLPADERVRSLVVRPHDLSAYDTLGGKDRDDAE